MNYYYGVKNLDSTFAAELDDKYRDLNDVINNSAISRANKLKVNNLILVVTSEDNIIKALSVLEKLNVMSIFVVVDARFPIRYNISANIINSFSKIQYKLFSRCDDCPWTKVAAKINKISKRRFEEMMDMLKVFIYSVIAFVIVALILLVIICMMYDYKSSKCNDLDEIREGIKIINNIQNQLNTLDSKVSMLDLAVRYGKFSRIGEHGL